VDDRLGVRLDGRVTDREDVGHRDRPAGVDLGAHREAAPGEAAGARHRARDALDERLVRVAAGAVLRQRLGEHGDAGVGQAQRLAADRVALARDEPGGEQLELDCVLRRPAGRAVDVAQPPTVHDAEPERRAAGERRHVGHGGERGGGRASHHSAIRSAEPFARVRFHVCHEPRIDAR
jgi:hypothetical protein